MGGAAPSSAGNSGIANTDSAGEAGMAGISEEPMPNTGGSLPIPAGGSGGAGAGSISSGGNAGGGAQFAGTWTGYTENYSFTDGSDSVVLRLNSDGTGQITFGDAPPPPPPTDPNEAYLLDTNGQGGGSSLSPIQLSPIPGFQFSIEKVSAQNVRLKFEVPLGQPWAAWCQLQTSVESDQLPGHFSCNPDHPTTEPTCGYEDPVTMMWTPMSCNKQRLCMVPVSVCACTADGCSLAPDAVNIAAFDLNLDGDKANGSVLGFGLDPHNVHLIRH